MSSSAKKSGDGLENFVIGVFKSAFILSRICYFGIRKINFKNFEMWCGVLTLAALLGTLLLGPNNYLYESFRFVFSGTLPFYFRIFFKMQPLSQYIVLGGVFIVTYLAAVGFKEFRKYVTFQRAIKRAGLKTSTGEIPKVKSIVQTGEHRSKVIVETYGVGIDKFEAQKNSLTASFRQTIERIVLNEDKGKVEIHLCERDLPQVVGFYELYAHIKEPYSFVIGQSLQGPLVQDIRSLPHLLISGATGGGKSVFFRSTILSLLKSSPHIQLYLLDLKRGVEVKEFAQLSNVMTANNEQEATNILGALVSEMNRRYEVLEKSGYKSIDPERDKLDLIVVGIDEAAALFGKKSNDLARKHIGELARLARAAGIHLIPSTQKPVKEAISTETLDNLPGRMTFRMISSAASNVAMGGNLAKKLPAIKGRAMWTNGSEHKEVQAPYVDDELINAELQAINQEFTDGIRRNFGSLLSTSTKTSMSQVKENEII